MKHVAVFKLFLLFLVVAPKSYAQTWVTIPDPNFVTYLQTAVPSAMNGNQMDITNTAVTSYTLMNAINKNISDLSGVQYFTSLKAMWVSNNSLTSLPALPGTLQSLSCSGNQLSGLPALPANLTSLSCGNNLITSLPALPATLSALNCHYNQLTQLPSLPNSLTLLQCNNNQLISLPSLPNGLGTLICQNNNINCFPIFPNSLNDSAAFSIANNPFNCFPNYVLPTMNSYTTTPLCDVGNSNGCPVAGIEQMLTNGIHVEIYPNPAKEKIILETSSTGEQVVEITDISGRSVLSKSVFETSTIDVSNLSEGIYSVSIRVAGFIAVKKLAIAR